jgi:hypothetical protein
MVQVGACVVHALQKVGYLSMWTSGAELSCSGGGSSFIGEVVLSGAGEDAGAGEVV